MSAKQNKNYFFCLVAYGYGDDGRAGNWRGIVS
jgi:hypothetical protein